MIKFFKNRFNILYLLIVALLVTLGFRMAVLTIVEGQDYRQIADIKKIKDIPVKAPRGKIFDRNGILLADNVSSFTVQMYTDEIKAEDFIDLSYKLAKIFDENMERPIDDFPIELYTFDYINKNMEIIQSDTSQAEGIEVTGFQTAEEKVIERVKENIYEWLNYSIFVYGENFSPKQRVEAAILKDRIPIKLNGENFEYNEEMLVPVVTEEDTAGENEEPEQKTPIQVWLSENNLRENLNAEEAVGQLLINNNKYLSSLFSNSKIRKLSYEFIKQKGLSENIRLNEFSFVQDEEYESIKRNLNASNEEITINTSAKDDFVILTMKNSIDNLLKTVYSRAERIKPGAILIDRLKEIYPDLPVKFIEEGETAVFEYTDTEIRDKYFNQQHMDYSTTPYNFVKELAFKNYDLLYNLVTDDDVKYFSQIELLKYVNPSISIADWEYTPLRDKKNWIINNLSPDDEIDDYSAKTTFKMLRESLNIAEEINDYEMRNMMVLRERYNRISYLSYHPVDICYSISEKTVAMISERSHELNGINIEIEPLRYYPQYESASHIIGYLGKISQDYELQEYVVEKGYSTDDIIGKTGLEEKFEDYLRGVKGKKTVEVNNVGRTIRSVSSEEPVPGNDVYITMDLKLQKKAEESLEKGLEKIRQGGVFESEWGDFKYVDKYENAFSGALVALDVKTNEVLALANYPAYDLNLFATGITTENWNSLLNDSKNPLAPRPLYNIAMLTAIQPGSTFKMITALSALEKGVNPNTTVYCAGTMKVGDRNVSCWIHNMYGGRHGSQTMYQAIMNSCNFYYWTTVLGENLATHQKHTVKVEAEDIIDMARKFGLDSKTGIEIDIPQEASGGVPSIEGKKSGMRVYLRLFLEANVERYLNEGVFIDSSMKNEIVEEIVSWIDREELMTRGEVYEGLLTLNLNPEKTNDNNIPLVDIIKYSYLNQATWTVGDNLNISIGQGDNAYTTLQMANYVSSIASGFRRNVSVIKEVKTYDGKSTDYLPLREEEKIPLSDDSYLDVVRQGMKLVSYDDSAKPYAAFPVEVGSKTGTAENQGINPETGKGYDDFAWYVAFAPYDDPQIAVACVLFEGGSGRYPIPIVRELIGEYLKIKGE